MEPKRGEIQYQSWIEAKFIMLFDTCISSLYS